MASENTLAYQLDWGGPDNEPSSPLAALSLPPAAASSFCPSSSSSSHCSESCQTAVGDRGVAGRGRVGRRSANFLPATRPRGLRGALVFAPRPGARWRKVEARGGARGTQRLRVAGPRGREGVDPACPGRTASHGPPQRPLPASAVRAGKDLCLPPAARSPGGLYTSLTTWSHQPPPPSSGLSRAAR